MRKTFDEAEQYRRTSKAYTSEKGDRFGAFLIAIDDKHMLRCIVSDGLLNESGTKNVGWEHVSVSGARITKDFKMGDFTPSWDDMCKVKALFWSEEECVLQFHPPKSQYVNLHAHVLHLWKPIGEDIKTPLRMLV